MVVFTPIPQTELEIGSHGVRQDRVIFIRKIGKIDPIALADHVRVVLIGNPEKDIRSAMKAGAISRPKLAEIIAPMSGNTYQKLRAYSDKFV